MRLLMLSLLFCLPICLLAQGHTREHTVTQSDGDPDLLTARSKAFANARVSIRIEGDLRIITANGLPNHKTGNFPNRGNPNAISEQQYEYRLPLKPKKNKSGTTLTLGAFGIAVNGIPFDPGAAEFYKGKRDGVWRYEALSGAVSLGIDESHAHVQPTGAYHYHGLPTALLKDLGVKRGQHSPIVGWALDGFPIYAQYGYTDAEHAQSAITTMRSSYQLKHGQRPSGANDPGGRYDGTFVADYEYKAGSGDLDEHNGRFTKTPDFPNGTYAYFLTDSWPVIPRSFAATPIKQQRGGGGGGRGTEREHGPGHGHPPHRHPPGRRPPPHRH